MNPVEHTPREITAADVLAFMRTRTDELSSKAPGYVVIQVETTAGPLTPQNSFRAYVEHIGWSKPTDDPSVAIEELAAKCGGKTESDLLRERAAEMLSKADELEKGGSQ